MTDITYRARIPLPDGRRVLRHVVRPENEYGRVQGIVFLGGATVSICSANPADENSWDVLRVESDRLAALHREGISSAY